MSNAHIDFLTLLESLGQTLDTLTSVEQRKTQAVLEDDLATLNDCMKQEQVLSLTLRGYEQKRITALRSLGLDNVPLSALSAHYPPDCSLQAKQVSESVLQKYQLYRSAATVALSTLECNLHQIEKTLAQVDGSTPAIPGYTPAEEAAPPKAMRTNFRA